MPHKNKYIILCCFLSVLFLSCSFFSIDRKDSIPVQKSTLINVKNYPEINSSIILGKVISTDNKHTLAVVACPVKQGVAGEHIYNFVVLTEAKEFIIYLPEGEYYIYAIVDLNNDYIFEDREAAGYYGNPDAIQVAKNEIKEGINIPINKIHPGEASFPQSFFLRYEYNTVEYTSANGQIKKIYSEIFSSANASTGWWHPSLFMKAFGANIYLTEKYDAHKIPVLFVHGAQGSPQDWAYFHLRLDKKKYQPMYFYYPSGLRLPLTAQLLYSRIKDIQGKYNFKQLYLIAHSMGGLIARSMLTQYYKEDDSFVRLFVTFATPWSGFDSADTALNNAPYVLPSWIDVSSHSMFIKTTMQKRIPDSIDYYLFYGKFDLTAEGSAFDSRAFTDTKGIYGFNADHGSILVEKDVFTKFNEILSGIYSN